MNYQEILEKFKTMVCIVIEIKVIQHGKSIRLSNDISQKVA